MAKMGGMMGNEDPKDVLKESRKKDVLSKNLFRGLRVVFWYVFGIFLLGYISNCSN